MQGEAYGYDVVCCTAVGYAGRAHTNTIRILVLLRIESLFCRIGQQFVLASPLGQYGQYENDSYPVLTTYAGGRWREGGCARHTAQESRSGTASRSARSHTDHGGLFSGFSLHQRFDAD